MAVIAYPYFPDRLEDAHPSLVQDLVHLRRTGHHDCIRQMIRMVVDLKLYGADSRFFKGLGGPLVELKSRSRGATKAALASICSEEPTILFSCAVPNANMKTTPTRFCSRIRWKLPLRTVMD